MNQSQCIERFSKKSIMPLNNFMWTINAKEFKSGEPTSNIKGNESPEENSLVPRKNPRQPIETDYCKEQRKFDTVKRYDDDDTKRKISTRTPIENMPWDESVFAIYKPNRNHAIEHGHINEGNDNENNTTEDTFQRAVSPILFLGQCCSALPVQGVLESNPKNMKFSLASWQVLVTVAFMGTSSVLTLSTLKNLLKIGISAKNFVGLAFFGCVQFSCLLFAILAPRWPKLMRHWYRIEMLFRRRPYVIPKRNLAYRIRLSAGVIIFLSVVEHGLYLCSVIISYRRSKEICAPVYNTTVVISFNDFIFRNYDYVFQIMPRNIYVGIGILIANGLCTFLWNYMDLFIMMVSKGIAYRFEQVTTRINKLANKDVSQSVFIEIREHYVKLCELLEVVDENLSGLILLSCINNLYFVCYQLLNVFNKLRWPINYIYFWYSLLYLMGRTVFVFLTAASINDESKGGLAVLRRVSSETWCVEVERLIFHMTTQTIALSGKKFYFLTRRLLFGMAGTIVTYELVLLQFDEPNRSKGLPDLCT
ncbi:gustatory receptor for sugar taste 64a-like [Haematobia irritans]|uniref:gustatory receptor for sugar taste 64a-like n=1 Tax=Haematobia irritans TaxID=7368 RepID=UPI003F50561E